MDTTTTSHKNPMIVRSGLVFTKGQHEDGLFGRASWKLRFVELTTDNTLLYQRSGNRYLRYIVFF
jgi:hypothetical protein